MTSDKAVSGNLRAGSHCGVGSNQAVDLGQSGFGFLQRGCGRHADCNEERSGILIGDHTGRCDSHQPNQSNNTDTHDRECKPATFDDEVDTAFILLERHVIRCVEGFVETFDQTQFFRTILCFMRLQEKGTKCRTQRQGVDSRDTDCDRHGQTELTVEGTGCTGHETYRNEHGHHDERNRYDRATDLAHGVDRSLDR